MTAPIEPAGLTASMETAANIAARVTAASAATPADAIGLVTAGAVIALIDRLDSLAAELASTVSAATSGGLLGLLAGKRP